VVMMGRLMKRLAMFIDLLSAQSPIP